jgi:hypothetical protein
MIIDQKSFIWIPGLDEDARFNRKAQAGISTGGTASLEKIIRTGEYFPNLEIIHIKKTH